MQRHTRFGLVLFAAACMALVFTLERPSTASAAEPAIVNPSWSLDFEFETPDAVAVENDKGEVQWYWYMPYTVTNNTGDDRMFIPEIIIYSDNGDILTAGKGIRPNVFNTIKELLNNPLLLNAVDIVGKLLKGEDFAKDGVAIWPATDDDVDSFTVFVGGIHGETQVVKNPKTGEEELLRRTLMLEFEVPGNFKTPQEQPVRLISQQDIMR